MTASRAMRVGDLESADVAKIGVCKLWDEIERHGLGKIDTRIAICSY